MKSFAEGLAKMLGLSIVEPQRYVKATSLFFHFARDADPGHIDERMGFHDPPSIDHLHMHFICGPRTKHMGHYTEPEISGSDAGNLRPSREQHYNESKAVESKFWSVETVIAWLLENRV